MKYFYLSLLILFSANIVFSQVEAEECVAPSKKVLKLIKAANESKTPREAVENFNKAIKLD